MKQKVSLLENHLADQLVKKNVYDHFFWHRVRWQAVCTALPEKKAFRLLDIGAGTGQVGRFLKRDFPKADYVFIEPISALNTQLIEAYGSEKNYSSNAQYDDIDFITCLDVIEHIKEDQKFIHETIEKMEVGTRMIITVPAINLLWSEWDEMMGHHRRYNKKELLKLFEAQPVAVNRVHYLFPEMFFAGLIRKSIAPQPSKGASEFPHLSKFVNSCFFLLSNTTRLLGPLNPIGSSLMIDVTKK